MDIDVVDDEMTTNLEGGHPSDVIGISNVDCQLGFPEWNVTKRNICTESINPVEIGGFVIIIFYVPLILWL